MYPPVVGAKIPMIDRVAMLRPRAVPVSESGTHFVMVLLLTVSRRVCDIVMGIRMMARRTMWSAKACEGGWICVHKGKHPVTIVHLWVSYIAVCMTTLLCAWLVLVQDKHMWPSRAEIKYFVCFPTLKWHNFVLRQMYLAGDSPLCFNTMMQEVW